MAEIGGSMGPLYGMMFTETAAAIRDRVDIDAAAFLDMLQAGLAGVRSLGDVKRGDKTMLDTLIPAVDAFAAAVDAGATLPEALERMARVAEEGKESTRGMVARIGRASRLGERSRGVLDAGATSCCLILTTLAERGRAAAAA